MRQNRTNQTKKERNHYHHHEQQQENKPPKILLLGKERAFSCTFVDSERLHWGYEKTNFFSCQFLPIKDSFPGISRLKSSKINVFYIFLVLIHAFLTLTFCLSSHPITV